MRAGHASGTSESSGGSSSSVGAATIMDDPREFTVFDPNTKALRGTPVGALVDTGRVLGTSLGLRLGVALGSALG